MMLICSSKSAIFDLAAIWPAMPFILSGVLQTVLLIIGAMTLGLIMGLPMGALKVYGPPWVQRLIGLYVWFFRGVPVLVLLFIGYFGVVITFEGAMANNFGLKVNISPFLASIAVLGMASAAYQTEIFRGAINSLAPGQFKAAKALGMTNFGAIKSIIIPQALRVSIPAWSNEYSILLKDSAVAMTLGTHEILFNVKAMASTSYKHLMWYMFAGVLYFILTWLGLKLLNIADRKTRIPGLGHDSQEAGSF